MPTPWRIISQVGRHSEPPKTYLANANPDSAVVLTPLSSPGVLPPDNTTAVHWGFLRAFNSVAETVISVMEEQYTFYPRYRLVCAGTFLPSATF